MNGTTTKGLSTTPLSPKLLSPTSLSPTTPLREHRSPSLSTRPILAESVVILNSAPVAPIPSVQTRLASSVSPAHTSTPPPSPPLSASGHGHVGLNVNSTLDTHDRSSKGPFSTSQQQHQPPPPPLQQQQQLHHHHHHQPEFGQPRSHHMATSPGQKRVSANCEATSAAAAAAAASYTSQELAIAYSMVTSETHKTHEAPPQTPGPREGDALSSLWKKTIPLQEPYFQTRHAIASQHTLSTLDGVLFSLDEEPKEFSPAMYIAMRNRIFELEAKTVNYTPFNRSRKRPVERPEFEDYYGQHGDSEPGHYSKRQAHHPPHLPGAHGGVVYRQSSSHPSWYSPEAYASMTQVANSHQPPPHRHSQGSQPKSNSYFEQEPRPVSVPHRPVPLMPTPPESQPSSREAPYNTSAPPRTIQPRPDDSHQHPGTQTRSSPRPTPHDTRHHHSPRSSPTHHFGTRSHHSPDMAPRPHMHGNVDNAAAAEQKRQSFHQRQHRAQQQAQSDYSRSYHLQKHMQMIDQQRAAQLAQQKLQQHKQEAQTQGAKAIQRHYQPHQRMYPHSSQPIAIQPHPSQKAHPPVPPRPIRLQQHQQLAQQQLIQRYQLQKQLQQKQHLQQQQILQLQYLRQRQLNRSSNNSNSDTMAKPNAGSGLGGVHKLSITKQKQPRPLECSNCMALDSLAWHTKAPAQVSGTSNEGKVLLCPPCTQFLQAHGRSRPVSSFRTNFLKKIHCRFKRELQDVRFQGWQDAQVIEIDDKMTESEFQAVFDPNHSSEGCPSSSMPSSPILATSTESDQTVIKIEDDDDDVIMISPPSKKTEERAYQSEATVGELFGHRWRTEPMVGYTLVHFGGSDRTRMVPMNPTVPSLTVVFNRAAESVSFSFRVLVNGLCLLSSGGGPPALHMPEMVDEESEDEEAQEEEQLESPEGQGQEAAPPQGSEAA
ncbi:hypothetical protein BGZ59_007548 [Podila verticillata]|nr:hypothetical protein BGZ59_007548 [Podila verticillata]KAI9242670.1 MAG: hypothetical protein BYD32DRAFT_403034 [Podila humilis]